MKKAKIIFWISAGFLLLFEGVMPLTTLLVAQCALLQGQNTCSFLDILHTS